MMKISRTRVLEMARSIQNREGELSIRENPTALVGDARAAAIAHSKSLREEIVAKKAFTFDRSELLNKIAAEAKRYVNGPADPADLRLALNALDQNDERMAEVRVLEKDQKDTRDQILLRRFDLVMNRGWCLEILLQADTLAELASLLDKTSPMKETRS
jgi:hypothetical protein